MSMNNILFIINQSIHEKILNKISDYLIKTRRYVRIIFEIMTN